MSWSSCDLYDEFESLVTTCNLPLHHIGGTDHFWGPIQTVECHEDNVLLRKELEKPGKGRVLVVDGHGSMNCALCGDMVAGLGLKNGWCGLVINGLVRDVKALAQLDFGIMAVGSNPKKSRKQGVGLVGEPINFGSVRFEPGYFIYCDVDGILVGPKQLHKS